MVFETERMSLPVASSGRATRRAALFRESLPDMAERLALGFAWAMSPKRIRGGMLRRSSGGRRRSGPFCTLTSSTFPSGSAGKCASTTIR